MKKSELKTGMILETREGKLWTVFLDNAFGGADSIVQSICSQTDLKPYNNDLTWREGLDRHIHMDIMKIYIPNSPAKFLSRDTNDMSLVWVRQEIDTYEVTVQKGMDLSLIKEIITYKSI